MSLPPIMLKRFQTSVIKRVLINWKSITLCLILVSLFSVAWNSIPKDFPYNILHPDPYSVRNFEHGHVNIVPNFMISNESYSNLDKNPALNLMSLQIPLIVHYFWCKEKPFEFQNYLSILSAYRFLKPTVIVFHYNKKPALDSFGYYQFYGEMLRVIPILVQEEIPFCANQDRKHDLIFRILNDRGGIYIGEDTIITNPLSWYRNLEFSHAPGLELVLMKRGALLTQSVDSLLESNPSQMECVHHNDYNSVKTDCVLCDKQIFPKDIISMDTKFGELSRWIYFGNKRLRRTHVQKDKITPLIVHYVWLGKRPLPFSHYLSLLSAVYILKAESVYIHGDVKPTGPYWQKVEQIPFVKFIFREYPASVFSQPLAKWASHASDMLRADLLIRYGGIYTDWDVFWVNPMPEELRKYDAVVSIDWPGAGSYPDVFNLGVLVAQKGSKFLRYFLESYRHYLDDAWAYNAIHIPYKLYEQHSDIALEYPHLQVICAERKCHPTWLAGYRTHSHLDKLKFNWRNETLSIHITYPDPEEFDNEEALRASNTLFSEIGQFILKRALLL